MSRNIYKEIDTLRERMDTVRAYTPAEIVKILAPHAVLDAKIRSKKCYENLVRYVREALRHNHHTKPVSGVVPNYTAGDIDGIIKRGKRGFGWFIRKESDRKMLGLDAPNEVIKEKEPAPAENIIENEATEDIEAKPSVIRRMFTTIKKPRVWLSTAAVLCVLALTPFIAAHIRYDSDMIRTIIKENGPDAALKVGIYSKAYGIKLYYDTGYAHYMSGDMSTAREIAEDILEDTSLTDIDHARAWYLIALLYEAAMNIDGAYNALNTAMDYYVRANEAMGVYTIESRIALLQLSQGKNSQALERLESIPEDARKALNINKVLVSALIVLESHDRAIELSMEILKDANDFNKVQTMIDLHLIYQSLGESDHSWKWLVEALSITDGLDNQYLAQFVRLFMHRTVDCSGFQAPHLKNNLKHYILTSNMMHLIAELEKPCI